MSSSRYSTVNTLPRIISIFTGRMAPPTRPVPFVIPTICSPLPLPSLAYNAQRTLFQSSLWFLTSQLPHCCSIACCIGYFELFCALLYTLLHYACHSVYRSTAQWTVYLHRQELFLIDGQFCRYLRRYSICLLFYATLGYTLLHRFYFTSILLVR